MSLMSAALTTGAHMLSPVLSPFASVFRTLWQWTGLFQNELDAAARSRYKI